MTTLEGAVAALRKLHKQALVKPPKDWKYLRCEALTAFNAALREYIKDLPDVLNEKYNRDARWDGWFPIPFEHGLLNLRRSRALWIEPRFSEEQPGEPLAAVIERQSSVVALCTCAKECGAKFTLSVRPDGISIVCNFLPEGEGEVIIQCA